MAGESVVLPAAHRIDLSREEVCFKFDFRIDVVIRSGTTIAGVLGPVLLLRSLNDDSDCMRSSCCCFW